MFWLPNKTCAIILIRFRDNTLRTGHFCVTYGTVLLNRYSYKSIYKLVILIFGILKSLIFSEYYSIIMFSGSKFGSKFAHLTKIAHFCPIPNQAP